MSRKDFGVMLSAEEKKRLQAAATKIGMALGTYIRVKALAAMEVGK